MVSAQVRLALQAMRYYRLWIYASNLVLMAGVIIFASVAAALLSDPRRQLLPAAAVSPHQPSVVYAYAALFLQGAVLPVVGCIGALRLSEKLLNSYWILLLVLLAGDMIVGLVWVFRFQKLVAGLVPDLKNRLSLDYGHDPDFDAAWDLLQRSARCCGVESPADFNNSLWLANLADRPAWQPSGMSTNRVQLSSTPTHGQGGRSLRPSLIRDQRVSRLPLPDSCCKSASFTSEQLRKNGHFMSMASEVPPGRKEVYGTGKHRQQLRDYNERYHERMMREQLHLQQQQQQQQLATAGNLSLNHRTTVQQSRIQRRVTTTTTTTTTTPTTAAPTIAISPSGHKKDVVQHRQQQQHPNQHRHRGVEETDDEDEIEEDEDDASSTSSVECGGVWPSVGDVSDVHESGCGEFVSSWLHMTGDTLFVLGYCVLAFIKLCFLAILRYELREMVAKIKILQSEQALMNSSTAAGTGTAGGGPGILMPFTHCEMSGIRAVMARGSAAPTPPALVASDITTTMDQLDNFNNGQQQQQAHLPNGEVPSGGGGTTTTTTTTGLSALKIPRPRRQSSFSSGEYHLINPFVQQQQQLQQQGEEEEEEEEDNETDNDLFSPPDTPIHHLQPQQQQQQQHRTAHQLPQNNDNGADSDSGSHCALLPSSCNSTGPPQRRVIHKEWDPLDTTTTTTTTPTQQQQQQTLGCTSNWVQPLQQQQHENGWPGRPNGNNNEYHELREIKQTQI